MGFVICDAPKRSEVRNWKGHNSYDGCTMCLQTGASYHTRDGHKVIWPYYRDEACPRTHKGVREYLRARAESREQGGAAGAAGTDTDQGKGVIGESPLMALPGFDIVLHVPAEPMHLLYEGIIKLLIA